MTLCCYECESELGPGTQLPGREGTIVYPVLQSLIYLPTQEGIGYKIGYLVAPNGIALCFKCVEGELLKERRVTAIEPIYDCYETEMNFRMVKKEQERRWSDATDSKRWLSAYNKFKTLSKKLTRNCIFCDSDVKSGRPFFIANAIDRIYSSQHLSGIFVLNNYSWSDIKTGLTKFRVCFDDFRKHFPRTFEQLSYDTLGEKNPNLKQRQSELIIDPSFEKKLFEETGKTVEEFFDEKTRKI